MSRSEIYGDSEADRARQRAQMRAEAESLSRDQDEMEASRELAAEMEAIRAW